MRENSSTIATAAAAAAAGGIAAHCYCRSPFCSLSPSIIHQSIVCRRRLWTDGTGVAVVVFLFVVVDVVVVVV